MDKIDFNLSDYIAPKLMSVDEIGKQMYQMPFELMQKEAELRAKKDANMKFMELAPVNYLDQMKNMVLPGSMSDEDVEKMEDYKTMLSQSINNISSNWDNEKSPLELDELVKGFSKYMSENVTPKVKAAELHNRWLQDTSDIRKTLDDKTNNALVQENIGIANTSSTVEDAAQNMAMHPVYKAPEWNEKLSNENLESAIKKSIISSYSDDVQNLKEAGYIGDYITAIGRSNYSEAACDVINGILMSDNEIRHWFEQWCRLNGHGEDSNDNWLGNLEKCLSLDRNGNLVVNENLPDEIKGQAKKAYTALTQYSITAKKLSTPKERNGNDRENGNGNGNSTTTVPITTATKKVHLKMKNSWSDLSSSYKNGDRVANYVVKTAGQNAIDEAGIDWHFTDDDVNYMMSTDFAQEFGFYEEQDEDNKSEIRSYKIRTYKDAKDATKNGNFVYYADKQGNVYVSKTDGKNFHNIYKLHGNAEYYDIKRGTYVQCNDIYCEKAREDFAAALYATTSALKENVLNDVAVSEFDMQSLSIALTPAQKNSLNLVFDNNNFSIIYEDDNGYNESADSFTDGTKINSISVDNINGISLGTRISEIVLECTQDNKKFMIALKPGLNNSKKEQIYSQLSNFFLQTEALTGTVYEELLKTPDCIRTQTYIHAQPVQESNGKKYQALQLTYNNVIRSGFDNIPISMEGMTIFHIFDEDGNSYYDIRNNKDPNKGSSILGDLRIDNAYDFAQYMNLFNVLFNEVPERLDEEKSKTTCERWLFGVDESEMGNLSDEDKKRVKAYGKRTRNTLQNIENNTSETVRDRIAARLLQGNTAFFPQGGGEEIKNGQYGEGMCYFDNDNDNILHILFRQDGKSGWAEFVVDTENDTFYIQPSDKPWAKEKTTKFYKTSFYKR